MPKPTEYDKTHLRNMAAIGTRIDRIFKKAAEEAAKIGVSIKKTLPEDRIFSFDDYPETRKQIERLMTALQESMETTIVSGVRSAWTLSNNKNNALVSRIFGDRVGDLSKEQYRRYFSTNGAALDAFLGRKEQGLNLSDRVWRYTNAFKHEIELGLDLGIRTGESAAKMTRSLRQYLQHPDKLFRRVRDKHGNLRLSKAAQAFHPGRGVYRSSDKNARRLACTETNMAYRTSDHLRWQQMDFVVGIEIKLSNNHTLNGVPLTDICDELKGRYPKDFKFVGWHPHCRCHVVTVLKTEEEMQHDTQRILAGEKPEKGSVNAVRDVPAAFKGWVEEHADRIEMGGNLPYFVKDNRKRVDTILGIAAEPQKTPLEIAKERHDARTPEQATKIQQEWNENRLRHLAAAIDDGYLPKEVKERLEEMLANNSPEHFEEIKARIAYLQKTAQRHAARTPQEIEDIKKDWEAKLTRDRNTRIMADNILKLRSEYPLDLDFSALEKIVADNNLTKMREEARNVAQAIKTIRAEEKALSDLIPDVHEWHKTFSLNDLKTVKASILSKLDDFKAKGWGDFDTKTNLGHLKHSLEWQANYMATKGQVKYKTWEVAQKSYLKLVDKAQDLIEWENIETDIAALKAFKTKSKDFEGLLDKAIAAQAAGDKAKAQLYIYNAGLKKDALEAAKAKRASAKAAKSASSSTEEAVHFGDECFTEARRKAAKIFRDEMEAEYSELFDDASRLYQAAADAFKAAAEDYTEASGYLTKWLRGMDGYLESSLSYAEKAERHTRALSMVIGQAKLKRDMWLFRDERAAFLTLKAGGLNPDTLQAQIEEYTRKITARYNAKGKLTAKRKKELGEKIAWFTDWRARQLVGRKGIDPSILSCGSHERHRFSGTGGDNMYGIPKVRLEIYCPKGTQAMYAAPFNYYNRKVKNGQFWDGTSHTLSIREAEVFLQRDTEFRIIAARWDAAEDRWFVKVEVLGHRARDFEMESTPRGYKAKFK